MGSAVTPADALAFESRGWVHAGAKEQAIVTDLGITVTRYYSLLRDALLDPTVCAQHPTVAARLHRILFERPRQRSRVRWAS